MTTPILLGIAIAAFAAANPPVERDSPHDVLFHVVPAGDIPPCEDPALASLTCDTIQIEGVRGQRAWLYVVVSNVEALNALSLTVDVPNVPWHPCFPDAALPDADEFGSYMSLAFDFWDAIDAVIGPDRLAVLGAFEVPAGVGDLLGGYVHPAYGGTPYVVERRARHRLVEADVGRVDMSGGGEGVNPCRRGVPTETRRWSTVKARFRSSR